MHHSEITPLLTPTLKLQPWTLVKQPGYYKPRQNMENPPTQMEEVKKQNSLVTVFAVWNTMMGTSLLAMPWGIGRAGLLLGPVLVLLMGALCLYTAHSNIRVHAQFGSAKGEISQLARDLVGPRLEIISKLFSIIVLLGANLVYWILMSNFLYHSVSYLHDELVSAEFTTVTYNANITVTCPSDAKVVAGLEPRSSSMFSSVWNLEVSVPIFLSLLIAPLLNFKSPTFFTKFNSLGTVSVGYLVVLVVIKACQWGINVDPWDESSPHYTPLASASAPATAGMLALSYFIHNIIITIMRSNAEPKKNGRDLTIAYILVVITYLIIGVLFYISFPLVKSCIEDNLLNNFTSWDVVTVVGRMFLLFQLVTVFPLIAYMLRNEALLIATGSTWPGLRPVLLFNLLLLISCILTAIFLPRIGTIIRYTGAVSGLIHIFSLPCILRLAVQRKTGSISSMSLLLHIAIPIIGAANLVGQFFVSD